MTKYTSRTQYTREDYTEMGVELVRVIDPSSIVVAIRTKAEFEAEYEEVVEVPEP